MEFLKPVQWAISVQMVPNNHVQPVIIQDHVLDCEQWTSALYVPQAFIVRWEFQIQFQLLP